MTRETWQADILSKFRHKKTTPKGIVASCPAHDDKNPSLLVSFIDTNDGAKARIKCLAGCEWENILSSAGIEKKDVFFNTNGNGHKPQFKVDKNKGTPKKEKAFIDIDFDHPTKIYSYTDENGKELYQNCRFETDKRGNRLKKKTFRQRRMMKDGEWAYALNDVRRVPYNFPALIKEPYMIVDCEGEKDADNLKELGIVATSTIKECFKELHNFCEGKVVVVCEDNDEPGRKKAQEKAKRYWDTGAEIVKILKFREMEEGSDISDWIEEDRKNNDVFALNIMIDDLPAYNPLQDIIVDFTRQVVKREPLITIDGRNALPCGNVGGIVAGINQGKSHLAEIIASTALKPDCEPWSMFAVNIEKNERVAILDTEQPADDCQQILYRAYRRVGNSPQYMTDDRHGLRQLEVMSIIDLTIAERHEKLSMVIKRPEYKLIIMDGLLDFVSNPNDPEECARLIIWLHSTAAKYNKGVFCILHGNRNDPSGKGKGWLGDIFQRKATVFLMLRKHKLDPTIRVLTTDFENVKFRKAEPSGLNIAMQWDDDFNGFRCIPYPEEEVDKITADELFKKCLYGVSSLPKKQLAAKYMEITGKAQATAYREIDKAVDLYLKKENVNGKPHYVLRERF
jgi:hypothetical protein